MIKLPALTLADHVPSGVLDCDVYHVLVLGGWLALSYEPKT